MVTDDWLYDTLTASPALAAAAPGGVHADTAPPGTATPFVVFSLSDAQDVRVVDGSRVLTDATYLVKGVHEGSTYAPLEAVVDAIDAVLHNAQAVTAKGIIVWAVRERPIRYSEDAGGTSYRHHGALYRVQVREE
jgi:hypothetical protein